MRCWKSWIPHFNTMIVFNCHPTSRPTSWSSSVELAKHYWPTAPSTKSWSSGLTNTRSPCPQRCKDGCCYVVLGLAKSKDNWWQLKRHSLRNGRCRRLSTCCSVRTTRRWLWDPMMTAGGTGMARAAVMQPMMMMSMMVAGRTKSTRRLASMVEMTGVTCWKMMPAPSVKLMISMLVRPTIRRMRLKTLFPLTWPTMMKLLQLTPTPDVDSTSWS